MEVNLNTTKQSVLNRSFVKQIIDALSTEYKASLVGLKWKSKSNSNQPKEHPHIKREKTKGITHQKKKPGIFPREPLNTKITTREIENHFTDSKY